MSFENFLFELEFVKSNFVLEEQNYIFFLIASQYVTEFKKFPKVFFSRWKNGSKVPFFKVTWDKDEQQGYKFSFSSKFRVKFR